MAFLPPGKQNNTAENLKAGQFMFLNREESLGWPPDWEAQGRPRLWRYNLHYFEWLWSLEYDLACQVVKDWIARHDLARGRVGWEPYPLSLRLMNWCAVLFGKFRAQLDKDTAFRQETWRSMYLQSEWLVRHLETHLLGNHLFENAVALAFVGSCFDGSEAEKWYQVGNSVLAEEIPEQILPDGMHFERSAMYHLRLTYLLRLLLDTGSEELKNLVETPLTQMHQALTHLCHPDGQIALFNDSAFSIYNAPSDLQGTHSTTDPGPWALPEAGYYGYRTAEGSYIICDAGPIGPDYILGHAHGDIFSFELSLKGHRVIVDSGVYDYAPNEMRRYCRSTRAHNTVEVNEQDQCEFWGVFRVARRGYPRDVVWQPSEDGFRLAGWHDGYRRLTGSPRHHREFIWRPSCILEINDKVLASRPTHAICRLHLHPDCEVGEVSGNTVTITFAAGKFAIRWHDGAVFSVEEGFYCPEFGKKLPQQILAFSHSGSNIQMGLEIELL